MPTGLPVVEILSETRCRMHQLAYIGCMKLTLAGGPRVRMLPSGNEAKRQNAH
jgi:hypothetical protein